MAEPQGEEPELTRLANFHGSDKGTLKGAKHNYSALYEMLFRPRKFEALKVLEIGLQVGGPEVGGGRDRNTSAPPSIAMWLDYFPNAEITGFDISDFARYQSERFRFMRGDSGSVSDLRALAAQHGPFDIIIDDASHASFHQQLQLAILFPALKPAGLYIIEDLNWQPASIEQTLPETVKTRDLLREIAVSHAVTSALPLELEALRNLASAMCWVQVLPSPFSPLRGDKVGVIFKMP